VVCRIRIAVNLSLRTSLLLVRPVVMAKAFMMARTSSEPRQ
jgi:hypothetical protein